MAINTQPKLENDQVILEPLKEEDFETLYAVASDPLIWEQHPNKDRWQRNVFQNFFEGAMKSKGAFKVIEKATGAVVGCTRIYDYNEQDRTIFIGYTFFARSQWGKGTNRIVKTLLLNYFFHYVDTVYFHIGASNLRSQIAIGRLGAEKVGEEAIAYFGEPERLNFLYAIKKTAWLEQKFAESGLGEQARKP